MWLIWTIVGIIVVFGVLMIFSLCRVSSMCSRMEEKEDEKNEDERVNI